jgi:peptidoglycan-N-acetylglucosamine deacetylase
MIYRLLYPGFKERAVTFSYDDGVLQDRTLIAILNASGLKATFNLNPGKSGEEKIRKDIDGKDVDCSHLILENSRALYAGHEIADHTFSHPHLEGQDYSFQREEFAKGRDALRKIFGTRIQGGAYPYGSYDRTTWKALKDLNFDYCRTTRSTLSFDVPRNPLFWNPTIHHTDPLLFVTLDRFYAATNELPLLMVWGHSYEFALAHNFGTMERLCRSLAARDDVFAGTNQEILSYVRNADMVYFHDNAFINPSLQDVYLTVNGEKLCIASGEKKIYETQA